MIDGQFPRRVLGQVLKRDLRLALSDHQVYYNQTLEYDGPRGISESIGEGAKDFSDASLPGVCGDKYMFDIFGLGRGELDQRSARSDMVKGVSQVLRWKEIVYLDLRATLH